MCLELRFDSMKEASHYFENPQLAKKDISVYKYLDRSEEGTWLSPIYQMVYEPGMIHYQTGKKFTWEYWKVINQTVKAQIDRGLHSFSRNRDRFYEIPYWYRFCVRHEMIIPKGSEYYLHQGHYVSDQLLFPHQD